MASGFPRARYGSFSENIAFVPLFAKRKQAAIQHYAAVLPGDRVQIDSMNIGARSYQFKEIDYCTRIRVLRVYPQRNRQCAISFLYEVLDSIDFPIRVVQTDWGTDTHSLWLAMEYGFSSATLDWDII